MAESRTVEDIAALADQYVGRQEVVYDEVSATMARRMAATLNRPAEDFDDLDTLPDGWHVILFPPLAATRDLGHDGHPKKGDFLPDLGLPRRMFASRRIICHKPLSMGDSVTRTSTVAEIVPKEGRSGLLAFVKVVQDIEGLEGLAITEEQTIVYRPEPAPDATPPPPEPAPETFDWQVEINPTPEMLFRYSALTFNAHRIHYDAAYAQKGEGYPERVVNGGLSATLMVTAATDRSKQPLAEYSVRNRRPLFVGRPFFIRGTDETDDRGRRVTRVGIADHENALAVSATMVWRS